MNHSTTTTRLLGLLCLFGSSAAVAFPDDVADYKYRLLASEKYVNASTYALVVDSAARNAGVRCGEATYSQWHRRNDVRVAAARTHLSHFGRSPNNSTHDAVHGVNQRIDRAGKNVAAQWLQRNDCLTLQNQMGQGAHDLRDAEFTPALDHMAKLYGYRAKAAPAQVLEAEAVAAEPSNTVEAGAREWPAEPVRRESDTHFTPRHR